MVPRDPGDPPAAPVAPPAPGWFQPAGPDGYALFLGTMYVPTVDRDAPGGGFTHRTGDVVVIENPFLGRLANVVGTAEAIPRWSFGVRHLWRNLAERDIAVQRPGGLS